MKTERFWLLLAVLASLSLFINTVGGQRDYPPFAMSDEIGAGLEARTVQTEPIWSWLTPINVASGYEHAALVPLALAQRAFGATLGGGRAAHVIAGALTVAALFAFASHLLGLLPAFCAAVFLMVNHVEVHLSRAFICAGVQSAAFMALALWAITSLHRDDSRLRTISQGVLAGVAVGWGTQTYKLAHALPILLLITILVWWRRLPSPSWVLIAFLAPCAALIAPSLAWHWRHYPDSTEHVRSLFVGGAWRTQVWDAAVMWWVGHDHATNYGAQIPVLDSMAGTAFAVGLGRCLWDHRSSVSALVVVWLPALMLGAVGLVKETGYYRLSMPLVFVCLVAGWGLATSAAWLPMRIAVPFCLLVLTASAYENLAFTFYQYPNHPDAVRAQLIATRRFAERACEGLVVSDDKRLTLLDCPHIVAGATP